MYNKSYHKFRETSQRLTVEIDDIGKADLGCGLSKEVSEWCRGDSGIAVRIIDRACALEHSTVRSDFDIKYVVG